jgi:hypothetical protein
MSPVRFSFFLVVASACFFAGTAVAQNDPPGVNPSHYWTYSPSYGGHYSPEFIQVRDQFFQSFTPVYLDTLERFINWVHKNGSPVPDTLIHYTWWNIVNKLPNSASAILTNQFGQFPAQIGDLQFMLVPAWKNQPQPGNPAANHYLCYKAFGAPPPPQILDLVDEWRHDVQPLGDLEYLCTPCWKEHNGQVFPALDEATHLAMYRISPTSERFFPFIQDQFFSGTCDVFQQPFEYLLVPTLKQILPTDVKKASWGQLKTIYR